MNSKIFLKENFEISKSFSIQLNSSLKIINSDNDNLSYFSFKKYNIEGKSVLNLFAISERSRIKSLLLKFISGKNKNINFNSLLLTNSNIRIPVKINSVKINLDNDIIILLSIYNLSEEEKYNLLISELHKCSQNFNSNSKKNVQNTFKTLSKIFNSKSILFTKSNGEIIYNFSMLNGKNAKDDIAVFVNKSCKERLKNNSSTTVFIPDLSKQDFGKANKFFKLNKFKTYLGKIVKTDEKYLGIICIFFTNNFIPDNVDLKVLDILSTIFAIEESKISTEQSNLENESRFKSLFDNSTVGIYRSTPKGKIVFANPKFISLLGYDSLEDLQKIDINKNLYLNHKNRKEFKQILEKEHTIYGYLENLKRKDGTIVNIRESSRVIKDKKNGKILFYEGTIEDITTQKIIENALIESEDKFRSIFQSSGFGICIVSGDKKFIDVNPKFCDIFGYSKQELLKMTFMDLTHPDFIKSSNMLIKELFQRKEKQITIEKKYIKKNGEVFWGAITVSLLTDKTSGKTNLLGISEDITQRIQFINDLKIRDQILSALSFSTETFLKTLDWQANINEVLKRLSESLKVKRSYIYQNIISKDDDIKFSLKHEWVDYNISPKINDPIFQNFSYGKYNLRELYTTLLKNEIFVINSDAIGTKEKKYLGIKNKKSIIIIPIFESNLLWGFMGFEDFDNKRIWLDQEIEAIKTAGNLFGVAIKRKIFEEELLKAKINAEESEKLKSHFLAQISHEIRSPINSILSFTNLVKEEVREKIDPELKSSFEIIESAGNRITRTIDLILNMSEIQTNTYEYIPRKVDIYEEILIPLASEFKTVALAKGLEFKLTKNSNNTIKNLDPYTVMQIFANLIDNAIKYTNKGKVEVEISKDKKRNLIVSVIDTGIGISSKYLPKLFIPFSQEEQGYSRKFEGNGLGLALVKNYCELIKADISVKSKKNAGTTFSVHFS